MSDRESSAAGTAGDTALELMKQLITLSSGVLVLSATFIDKFRWSSWWHLAVLVVSWLCLILAVLMGLETISAIVKTRLEPEEHDWSSGRGLNTARASKYGFVLGIGLFAFFAFLTMFSTSVPSSPEEGSKLEAPEVSSSEESVPP